MSKLDSRVKKLEDAAGAPGDFTFILVSKRPKMYQGNDGKLYNPDGIAKRLSGLGDKLQLVVGVGWGIDEEPKPNTLYIDWGDEQDEY